MEFLLLKYTHILTLVYWLGGDLGTFFASNYVINRQLSPEARHTALKIMLACDQGPKIAMPLSAASGIHLAYLLNVLTLPGWGLLLVWLLALVWVANVLYLHARQNSPFAQRLAAFDLFFRVIIVVALLLFAALGLGGGQWIAGNWVAWKLLVFAALVGCGILIRINLRPFTPAFGRMLTEGPSESTDNAMQSSLLRCRPFVWAIWLGLFVNAAIGVHLIG